MADPVKPTSSASSTTANSTNLTPPSWVNEDFSKISATPGNSNQASTTIPGNANQPVASLSDISTVEIAPDPTSTTQSWNLNDDLPLPEKTSGTSDSFSSQELLSTTGNINQTGKIDDVLNTQPLPSYEQWKTDYEKDQTPSSSSNLSAPENSTITPDLNQKSTNLTDMSPTLNPSENLVQPNFLNTPSIEEKPYDTKTNSEPGIENQPSLDMLSKSSNIDSAPKVDFTSPPPPPSFSPPPPSSSDISTGEVAADLRPGGLKSKLIFIILGAFLLIVLGLLGYKFLLPMIAGETDTTNAGVGGTGAKSQVTLTYWGLWEPNEVLQEVLDSYKQQNPNVTINYVPQSIKDYRERLQSAINNNQGPDIFRYHNTWLPMLIGELQQDTTRSISLSNYYPTVTKDISMGGEVYGVPLEFDALTLFYNPAMLQKAGVEVPTTWFDLKETAKKLTIPNSGPIQVAGVALGTTNNVDHFSDILGLMLLQNHADPANPTDKNAEDTLTFYTQFSTVDRVWDETLPASTYAFATEKVAMIFAPSWRAFEIAQINPNLKFAAAPVPQLPGEKTAWATYWVEGVSRKSNNAAEAWKFLAFMSKDENLTKLYTAAAKRRMFGEIYPKKPLAQSLSQQPIEGAVVAQGDYAKSWYLASRTYDNGINDKTIKYYEDAINAVLGGNPASQALTTLSQGVTQVLSQYGVATAPVNQNPSTGGGIQQ